MPEAASGADDLRGSQGVILRSCVWSVRRQGARGRRAGWAGETDAVPEFSLSLFFPSEEGKHMAGLHALLFLCICEEGLLRSCVTISRKMKSPKNQLLWRDILG